MNGAMATDFDTGRNDTLFALLDAQVMGKWHEWVLNDLYPGKGKARLALMGQGAGEHACRASGAFVRVHDKITLARL